VIRNNPRKAPKKDDFRLRRQRSTHLSHLQTPTQARRAQRGATGKEKGRLKTLSPLPMLLLVLPAGVMADTTAQRG
jgi:hypothetical protein